MALIIYHIWHNYVSTWSLTMVFGYASLGGCCIVTRPLFLFTGVGSGYETIPLLQNWVWSHKTSTKAARRELFFVILKLSTKYDFLTWPF